jgi:hypothetical protein
VSAELVRSRVYAIRIRPSDTYQGTKMAWTIVGLVEGVPDGSQPVADEANHLLSLWVHSKGLPPTAIGQYHIQECHVTPYTELLGASEPIDPSHGSLSTRRLVELLTELVGGTPSADRVKTICAKLGVAGWNEAVQRFGHLLKK